LLYAEYLIAGSNKGLTEEELGTKLTNDLKTNGTITGKTIVYSYNIVDEDKGQLAVTEYAGGTIKDAAGNDAIIETKLVSGNTIKANEEGITNNNTENQDEETTTGDETEGTTTGDETTEETPNDETTAPNDIPKAGAGIGIILAIIAIIIAGIVVYSRYSKMKDI